MTPQPSLTGRLARAPVLRSPWLRRLIVIVALAVLTVLALFPQPYRAAVTLTPTDPSSLGLSGTLNQLGAFSNVFGNQASIEVSLKVARGVDVRRMAIKQLKLTQKLGLDNDIEADRWLVDKVDVRALRGGILLITLKHSDSDLALAVVSNFADSTRTALAEISRMQTAYKREVLVKLVTESADRFARAEGAYNQFRRSNNLAEPNSGIRADSDRVPALTAEIRAKQIALGAARTFATDKNMAVRQILAEIAALRNQLADAKAVQSGATSGPGSVAEVVERSTELSKLERELGIARGLYDSYTRFLQGTSVEDMTSTASVRILEKPYIDSARQVNNWPVTLAAIILLLALAIEFYNLRPPLGDASVARQRGHDGRTT